MAQYRITNLTDGSVVLPPPFGRRLGPGQTATFKQAAGTAEAYPRSYSLLGRMVATGLIQVSTVEDRTLDDNIEVPTISMIQTSQVVDNTDQGFLTGVGPADNSYLEITPTGDPFYTSEIWYTDTSKTKKIVELTITRNSSQFPITEEWKFYAADGFTVRRTITDSITYASTVFESTRTRVDA